MSGDGDDSEPPAPARDTPQQPIAPSIAPIDELGARRRFDTLAAIHLPALRARARQLCRSHFDPDDLVQDTLLRAFRTRRPVSDPQRVRPWLLTILTNAFIDLTRKRRRRPEDVQLFDMPAPEPIEPEPWDHIDADSVRRAVEQLPDDVRDTYRMFAFEGRDHTAIAAAQQIPRATVASRVFRARRQLRELLTRGPATRARGRGPQ